MKLTNLLGSRSLPASELVKYLPSACAEGTKAPDLKNEATKPTEETERKLLSSRFPWFSAVLRRDGLRVRCFHSWRLAARDSLPASGDTASRRYEDATEVLSSRTLPFDAGALRAPAGRRRGQTQATTLFPGGLRLAPAPSCRSRPCRPAPRRMQSRPHDRDLRSGSVAPLAPFRLRFPRPQPNDADRAPLASRTLAELRDRILHTL